MITAGVDIGSTASKGVLVEKIDDEFRILTQVILRTGGESVQTAHKVMDELLKQADIAMEDVGYIVSTGYGRVMVPFADKNVTEISCHAKGSHFYFPGVRTILDMGGQDCKAISCNAKGKVTNFVMNDKCAAGAGRYMEVVAKLTDKPLEKLGELSLQYEGEPSSISAVCVLFARGEILALRRKNVNRKNIIAGACDSLVKRSVPLLKRVGVKDKFVVSGGIANNVGVIKRVEDVLGQKAHIASEPQTTGALGAAIFAQEILERKK